MKLEKIYELYFNDIYKYIYGMSKNKAIAEDITSETFLKAIKNFDSSIENVRAWLFTIAKNLYFTYQKREKIYSNEEVEQEYENNILENMVTSESALTIHKYLHLLKEPYKEVFMFRVFGELSFLNIGEIFSKSDTWSRVTFYRAKTKILKLMEENENE